MSHDISEFLSFFINLIFEGMFNVFNFLISIEFYGTNLFEFSLAIIISGLVLNIILSILRSRIHNSFKQELRRSK